jgi:hypothetical protein
MDPDLGQVPRLARVHRRIVGPAGLQRAALKGSAEALQEAPTVEGGEGVREDDEEDETRDERVDDRVAALAHSPCIVCRGLSVCACVSSCVSAPELRVGVGALVWEWVCSSGRGWRARCGRDQAVKKATAIWVSAGCHYRRGWRGWRMATEFSDAQVVRARVGVGVGVGCGCARTDLCYCHCHFASSTSSTLPRLTAFAGHTRHE